MKISYSERLKKLPPYLFVEIDKAKRRAKAEGRDIIDLGVGDPDLPAPSFVVEALYGAAQEPSSHRYALDQGMPALREAIANWHRRRFSVTLDPDAEILPLIGSKEGIAHMPLAFLNNGDYSLVPDPSYPPYKGGTILAGGRPYLMPLFESNGFLPDLDDIPRSVIKRAKLVYVNYPNNPTAACAEKGFYKEVVRFAAKNRLIVVSDLAYSEISYDGYRPPSILETAGAKEVAVEFHSLSKTYNMAGWRVGWACGNKGLVAALAKIKSNIDSGIFSAIQVAGVTALKSDGSHVKRMRAIYEERRDILSDGLRALGWDVIRPRATFYIWTKIPKEKSSMRFARELLEAADIVATPGVGFGRYGEGYIRFALTVPKGKLNEAAVRLERVKL